MSVPARQAHSHWASVGSVNFRPVFCESQWQNAMASFQVTRTTGWFGWLTGIAAVALVLVGHADHAAVVLGSKAAYWALVISIAPM